ncbi:hypothetical protein D7B24_006116 [Verticillium nonalfalfae]|uniref:Uncharacterized protein n=1 Tax=Verticillium nonalfalfae TaxID=1051616 RepID=A0A3M9YA09_9PEZI|nr:uncharacterized protein D7B24_006116 [Verticillium nonalfalfae]RNJ57353.1 hypothetical protein D7B24_006116 [Verticillium nonalfalfae]
MSEDHGREERPRSIITTFHLAHQRHAPSAAAVTRRSTMCNLTNLIVSNTNGTAMVNASTNAHTDTNGKPVAAKAVEAPKPVNADNPWTCVCGYRNEYGGMICGACGRRG